MVRLPRIELGSLSRRRRTFYPIELQAHTLLKGVFLFVIRIADGGKAGKNFFHVYILFLAKLVYRGAFVAELGIYI